MPADPQPSPESYPAEKARQGEIVLKRPWQRAVFLGSLAGIVLLFLLAGLILWL